MGDARRVSASTRARSGAAPRLAKSPRAASSSNAAVSSSPRARQATPRSTRTRAVSYGTSSSCHTCRALGDDDQGIPNVAVGQVDRSPGVRSHRTKHATLKTCRELREISAGAASLLDLAYGQHDLDVGRKETYALRRLGGLAHSAADRGARGRCVRLGQAQQGQTRQRLPPAAAGVPVGCFGSGELPPQTVDLTLPVAGTGDRSPIHRLSGTLAGTPGLLDRVQPRTVKLHDLGTMHHARACECHHVWLLLAPSREGGCPLLCA